MEPSVRDQNRDRPELGPSTLDKGYIERLFKHFNMNNAHLLSTPIIVRSLDPQKDLLCLREPDDEILDPKVPYLNAIETLMYLA